MQWAITCTILPCHSPPKTPKAAFPHRDSNPGRAELASSQVRLSQLERDVQQLTALAAEKDERLAATARQERQLQQQAEQLRQQLREAEAQQRQQPARLQQQLTELHQQLEVVQHRAAVKEASSRKYKEAVRAFKVKLQERDDALSQRQAQILELHTELSQLQRLLKMGPLAAANCRGSPSRHSSEAAAAAAAAMLRCSYSPGRTSAGSRGGRGSTAEDALGAATDELERLRVEVHGFHVELAALQSQLCDKDALLQQALADAAALDEDRTAAAARAEEATQAAFHLERQLHEARGALEAAETGRAAAAQQLAAAEARLAGLQEDQGRSIRAEGELRVQVESLQEQLKAAGQQQEQLREQLTESQQREADAAKRIQQLDSRAEGLAARLDASASEAGHLIRRADRHETATSTLQAQLEVAARAASESEAVALEADGQLREAGRQLLELQRRCDDLGRRCEGLEADRQQALAAAAAAQASAVAAEQRAVELDSQLLLLGRSLREAEAAAQDWQVRSRQAEEARQELGHVAASSEAAIKQLQADLAQLQLSASAERSQSSAQYESLRAALAEARAGAAAAEGRALAAERLLAELRAALDSQERLLLVLRQQVEEGGRAAQQAAELEQTVQVLEAALAEQQHAGSQLCASAAAAEGQRQAEVCSLLEELEEKNSQLAAAEQRFRQLESLMQRIASRTGQSPSMQVQQQPQPGNQGSFDWQQQCRAGHRSGHGGGKGGGWRAAGGSAAVVEQEGLCGHCGSPGTGPCCS